MTVSTFSQSNFNTQTATAYKTALDGNTAAMAAIGDAFAPHAVATPNMTVQLDEGSIQVGSRLAWIGMQTSATITAPITYPRLDLISVSMQTGVIMVTTGVENTNPVLPEVPAGSIAVGQILLAITSTAITDSMIGDQRSLYVMNGGNLAGSADYTTNQVLANTVYGQAAHVADGIMLTLPASNGVVGECIYFYGKGTGSYSITNNPGQFIYSPSIGMSVTTGTTTLTVLNGGTAVLMSRGDGEFDVIGGSVLITNAINPLPVVNAVAANDAVPIGQADGRYGQLSANNLWAGGGTLPNGMPLYAKNTAGVANPILYLGSDNITTLIDSGGVGTVRVLNQASTALVPITVGNGTAANHAVALGQSMVGAVLQNMTASRAVGTTYTNSSSRCISVNVILQSTAAGFATLYINGVECYAVSFANSGLSCSVFGVVPPGATYIVSGASLISWAEVR